MNMFRVSCPDESEPPTKLRFDISKPPAKLRFDVSGPPTNTCFDESGPPTKLRFDVPGPPAKLRFDVSGLPTRKTCTTELAPPARIVALAEVSATQKWLLFVGVKLLYLQLGMHDATAQ